MTFLSHPCFPARSAPGLILGSLLAGPGASATVAIVAPDRAGPEQGPLIAWVDQAQEGIAYRWDIEGGTRLGPGNLPYIVFRTGNGENVTLKCLAGKDGGTVDQGACTFPLLAAVPPAPPTFSIRVSPRAPRGKAGLAAGVTEPDDKRYAYAWDIEGGRLDAASGSEVTLTAGTGARVLVRCVARHLVTGAMAVAEGETALAAPARIRTFVCEGGPLKPDTKAARLSWTLGKDPDRILLREERSGREWSLDGKVRSFPLDGPFKGRSRFSLTTLLEEQGAGDTERLELAVPGVSVLAGDAEHVGASYMKAGTRAVTPWGRVTGMAWSSPWLYFSQGDQHTVRRVRLSGGDVEEVAGLRGLPGQDRLCGPGHLVRRRFTPAGGTAVDDWLVLQPEAGCIQSFTEGKAAATVRVIRGSAGAESKGPKALKDPAAMAVHPATGHVFVADRGNRAIRMFTPMGEEARTLAEAVEADGIAVSDQGDVFYSDPGRHVVMVLRNPETQLTFGTAFAKPEVFAGAPDRPGAADGPRTAGARFRRPGGLAMDSTDRACLLIADTGNHLVRKVPADLKDELEVETVGGNRFRIRPAADAKGGRPDLAEDCVDSQGFQDGPQEEALFSCPRQVCGDGLGHVFVLDQTGPGQTPVIRLIAPTGAVTTVGGRYEDTTRRGRGDGKGPEAGFDAPGAIAVDAGGSVLVADSGNRCLRRIGPDGTVTVAAGSEQDPEGRMDVDDHADPEGGRFGALGAMGIDAEGRVLVVEPGYRRLRMVRFRKSRLSPPNAVHTIQENLAGGQVFFFPAWAGTYLHCLYGTATPLPQRPSECELKVQATHRGAEVVRPRIRLQAVCADRANRIWVVEPPDPERPGVLTIHRYACASGTGERKETEAEKQCRWKEQTARLPLPAACGLPRIAAMATDSRHNLFLADAGNGSVWKVDEAMSGASLVAGCHPYLGPVGTGFRDPLPAMQGIALTPEDDVVLTCGNAVLRITRPDAEAPVPWTRADFPMWGAPRPEQRSRSAAAARTPGLRDPRKEWVWQLARKMAAIRSRRACAALELEQARKRAAEQAAERDPSDRILAFNVKAMVPVLAKAQRAMDLAAAEAEAREAGYRYLLLADRLDAGAELAGRVSDARQAAFERLQTAAEQEALKRSDPRWAAAQVRMDYLRACQEAEAGALKQALEAVEAFEKANPGVKVPRFVTWTREEKGKDPP